MNKSLDLGHRRLHTKSFLGDEAFGESAIYSPHLQGTVTVPNSTGMHKGGVMKSLPKYVH